MKFGQSIGYNRRNIFLQIPYAKLGEEVSPTPFNKRSKSGVSLDRHSKTL